MRIRDILAAQDHRPYPMPERPWAMRQTWSELLFAHWEVPVDALAALIPRGLPLDTYEGRAYIGVVPFRMSWVRPRSLPYAPLLSFFPELNLRTYIDRDGKPGVFFFSLDAASPVAVMIARRWYNLPYFNAQMVIERPFPNTVRYGSERIHRGAAPAQFRADYGPTGPVYRAQPGTLDYWLTERYCLYTADQQRQRYRAEIQHVQWPLQAARARIDHNTLTDWIGLPLQGDPILHYAERITMVGWTPERLT
ncbi:MAG: DUF2071 domain-containing protein [Chloroflexi bacterium]|nr:DUF2071 domain-containing protein [Chloroflexota bacterium]